MDGGLCLCSAAFNSEEHGFGLSTCRVGCLSGDGDRIGVEGHFEAAVEGGEDVGGLRGARVLVAQCEQVVDVLALEEALLLRVPQHLHLAILPN